MKSEAEYGVLITTISIATSCFITYWFLAHSSIFKEWVVRLFGERQGQVYFAFLQKGIGILLMGLLPACFIGFISLCDLGVNGIESSAWPDILKWGSGFSIIVLVIPYISANKKSMQAMYPQVRAEKWDLKLIVTNGVIWALYLTAYEFLFRGLILHTVLCYMDAYAAISITTIISVTTHMPKGAVETFGTIPFSIALCLMAIMSGSIWVGVVIHLILALSNDYWALHYNPNMTFSVRNYSVTE